MSWIIKVLGCLCFFALISCGKGENEKHPTDGKSQTIVNQTIKKEFNEAVQMTATQFTAELNKALERTTAEFQNQAKEVLKKMEDQEKVQVGLDKEALTGELDTVIQQAIARFTNDINQNLEQAITQFRSQTKEILEKEKGDVKNIKAELDAAAQTTVDTFSTEIAKVVTAAQDKVADAIAQAADTAGKKIATDLAETASTTTDDITSGIAEATTDAKDKVADAIAQAADTAGKKIATDLAETSDTASSRVTDSIENTTAMANLPMTINTAINKAINDLKQQMAQIVQDTQKNPPTGAADPAPDPVINAMDRANVIIQTVVKNLESFVDKELTLESTSTNGSTQQGVIKQIFEDRTIQWNIIVTEEDKTHLADEIVNTIYNNNQYKFGLNNLINVVISNINTINMPREETAMLTEHEETRLINKFNMEMNTAVRALVEKRIRYNVGKIIDTKTAAEAVYTLQFDVGSVIPHRFYGKPIQMFISMQNSTKNFLLQTKGDCVRIKKEYLSHINLVLLYTNPVIQTNFPNFISELCHHRDEKYKCQPGNYNIQQVGEGESIDYVLRWEKSKRNNESHCQVFPDDE